MRKIQNTTTGNAIVANYRLCTSIFSKILGFILSTKNPDFGLVFAFNKPVREILHMFFVFYSLDVVFLDGDKKVIEIKRDFRPFTVYMPTNKAKYIVEIVAGKAADCKVGDQLDF